MLCAAARATRRCSSRFATSGCGRTDRYSEQRAELRAAERPAENRDALHWRLVSSKRPAALLTHLDRRNRPSMVDVGAKKATRRTALAEAIIHLPAEVGAALRASGHRTKKGPVFDTAIVAGVMAAKRTHELIPFCHPLPLDDCRSDRVAARRAHRHPMQRLRAPPDRRRDGSAHRRHRRGAHDLRHVQGALARYRDRERTAARKDRRQARFHARGASSHEALRSTAWCSPGAAARAWGRTRPRSPITAPPARLGDGAHPALRRARFRFGSRRSDRRPVRAKLRTDRR